MAVEERRVRRAMLSWLQNGRLVGFVVGVALVSWRVASINFSHRGGGFDWFLVPGNHIEWHLRKLEWLPSSTKFRDGVSIGMNLLLYGFAGGLGGQIVGRFRRTRFTHAEVDILCLGCGYDLRGNKSGVCSECGRPVDYRQLRLLGRREGSTGSEV